MANQKLIAPLLIVILAAGISGVLTAKKTTERRATNNLNAEKLAQSNQPAEGNPDLNKSKAAISSGRYETFSQDKVSESGYDTTVLFFYAGWCPECRSFKKAITSGDIPDRTQVLEVNYDTSSSLKKQYSVTIQSTFVKVDSTGKQISKWVGYEKEKSLQAVLANL